VVAMWVLTGHGIFNFSVSFFCQSYPCHRHPFIIDPFIIVNVTGSACITKAALAPRGPRLVHRACAFPIPNRICSTVASTPTLATTSYPLYTYSRATGHLLPSPSGPSRLEQTLPNPKALPDPNTVSPTTSTTRARLQAAGQALQPQNESNPDALRYRRARGVIRVCGEFLYCSGSCRVGVVQTHRDIIIVSFMTHSQHRQLSDPRKHDPLLFSAAQVRKPASKSFGQPANDFIFDGVDAMYH
jgi:hypothetical protein